MAVVTIFFPFREYFSAAPSIAVLLLSVAPDVKIISPSGAHSPPSAFSIVLFAELNICSYKIPILWSEPGFPNRSSAAFITASQHSAHGLAVAALSRYTINSFFSQNTVINITV